MLGAMVPDAWVYRAADRLIAQHGADRLKEVNRLICDALDHRRQDRALLWVRIRLAIVLQVPPRGAVELGATGEPRRTFRTLPDSSF